MVIRSLTTCIALSCAAGCTPLTFSKADAIDFSAYPVVRVEVWVGSHEDALATEYLVEELRESSGFNQIVYGPRVVADAVLVVDVAVSQVDDDDFESHAGYALFDERQRVVDSGEVDDNSLSAREAAFDALDEVVLHYHRAYRI